MLDAVSVIIPVYNGAAYLAEAIRSVFVQSLSPIDIIVVDDGSTDASSAVAEAHPLVRVLRRPHRGLAAALNDGIRHAQGDCLAFLDADDRWLPHKLASQVAALKHDASLDMVFGLCRQFTCQRNEDGDHELVLGVCTGINRPCLLVRRAAFLRVGYFVEDGGKHDFLDWYGRSLALKLRALVLDDVLYERRIHTRNMGRLLRQEQRTRYLRSIRDLVTRRRGEEAV